MSTLNNLMNYHNDLVKDCYKSTNEGDFLSWLYMSANFTDQYIEIPSNETLSGHTEVIGLCQYMHLLTE